MKKSLLCKTLAVILSVLLLLSTVFFAAVTVFVAAAGGYTSGYGVLYEEAMYSLLYSYAHEVSEAYERGDDIAELYGNCNFYYEITDGDKKVTNYNLETRNRAVTVNVRYRGYPDGIVTYDIPDVIGEEIAEIYVFDTYETTAYEYEETVILESEAAPVKQWMTREVTLYEKADKDALDLLLLAEFAFEFSRSVRYAAPIIAVLSFILFVLVIIFLFSAAGHRKGTDTPMLNRVDRIPFDLYTAICVAVVVLLCLLGIWLYEIVAYNDFYTLNETFVVVAAGLCGIAAVCITVYLVFLGYLLSFATRLKVGGLIRRTLVFKLVAFVFRIVKKLFCFVGRTFAAIPLVWKSVLIFFAVSAIELILLLCNLWEGDNLLIIWCLEKAILFPLIVGIAMLLRRLKKGGEAIAAGRIDEKIDTTYMPLDFGSFGRTLNNIGDGLSAAVDERLKSERMKTELITNVSHDIKTPLTSIVNYVDLIKKEEIESETVCEYIDVLDRQSARLKKLIDDLVEASKASTGNITVEPERLEVGVLLEQSLGEYAQRFDECRLTPVVTQCDEPLYIMADGRRLWRVFDNLLSNVCKYALPHTRVYISTEKAGEKAVITFRNISREQLNISTDELMERFVRGDSSRNTEGSGLGLSIARSLTELQGGELSLSIDGDLFKASLTFDAVE